MGIQGIAKCPICLQLSFSLDAEESWEVIKICRPCEVETPSLVTAWRGGFLEGEKTTRRLEDDT